MTRAYPMSHTTEGRPEKDPLPLIHVLFIIHKGHLYVQKIN